jgi:alkanesulfonate monooxygenase SsuD/methylene tetrahydromethanopterin reductase-like flavin-dependent oxidoreductase (luciferase family)
VVIDPRNGAERIRQIASMCDSAGIDALWVHDHLPLPHGGDALEALPALRLVAGATGRANVGGALRRGEGPPEAFADALAPLNRGLEGRFELSLATEGHGEADIAAIRAALMRSAGSAPAISVEAQDQAGFDLAARVADDVVVPAGGPVDLDGISGAVQTACERAARDPATIGVALEIPVSIGRTLAEAEARGAGEALFDVVGRPSEVGMFGTLERCQERVIQLAHAGVTDLRCIIPNNPDIQDVIAQLTAVAIGTVDVLVPGAPRSRDPDPPTGWGGRRT